MFDSLGYYLLFLFKISLSLLLSLIFYSSYKKDTNVSLKFYSATSIMMTALVAISNNIALKEEYSDLLLPLMILSLFIILSVFLLSKSYKEEEFLRYFLVIVISVSIGLGYYFSSITLSLIVYIINYSFDGVLKFFSNNEEDDVNEIDNFESLELSNEEELLKDGEESK